MKLLPAIDLMAGRCVRLAQGDFFRSTLYPLDPQAALRHFSCSGAEEVHIVDLDGARAGKPCQHELILDLARPGEVKLQIAGGFRTSEHVHRALSAGISRVVVGSLAIKDPSGFSDLLRDYGPDRLTLALDVRLTGGRPLVATHGWTEDSGLGLDEVIGLFPQVRHLLVTDIARDGMLEGPNLALIEWIGSRWPALEVQASGGVARLEDLDSLRDIGVSRVIVGKAIWEDKFPLAEGILRARG